MSKLTPLNLKKKNVIDTLAFRVYELFKQSTTDVAEQMRYNMNQIGPITSDNDPNDSIEDIIFIAGCHSLITALGQHPCKHGFKGLDCAICRPLFLFED